MTDDISISTTDVGRLALDLTRAPAKAQVAAWKVLEVGANKVKKGMAEAARGHKYLPQLPNYVSYDRIGMLGLEYEVGFDKTGQGNLANIAAFGTSKNAPVMDHTAPLRAEEPVIVAQLLLAAEKSTL